MSKVETTKFWKGKQPKTFSSESTGVSYPRHKRFVKGTGWELHDLCLSPDGRIVTSGFHLNGKTFLDVYTASRDKPKLLYSKEFEKYSSRPYQNVSFCDFNSGLVLVGVSDKLELFEIHTSKILRSPARKLQGECRSMTVIEEQIVLGISGSNKIFILNQNLDDIKSITLEGIEESEYPWDMTIVENTLFVITRVRGIGNRALSYGKETGTIITEFQNIVRRKPTAQSIAVSVNAGLAIVLWNNDQIIAYPISENKPLLVFYLEQNVRRIRISEKGYLVGGSIAGEIQVHYLEQIFSFDGMKRTLAHIISPEECQELQRFFGIAKEEMIPIDAGSNDEYDKEGTKKNLKRIENLLTSFEKSGYFDRWNISNLKNAIGSMGDPVRESILIGPIEGYLRHGNCQAAVIDSLEAEMRTKEKAWEIEKQHLSDKINELEKEHDENLKTFQGEQENMERQFAEDVDSLQKMLKEAEQRCHVERTSHRQMVQNVTEELEAEFTRLTVGIAEHLTLDDALKLAKLFRLPESVTQLLRSVSLQKSPGIKLLEIVAQRSIINMYDITNLQKAFEILRLNMTNNDLLKQYQQNVDDEQHRLYKLREIFTREDKLNTDRTEMRDIERHTKAACQKESITNSVGGDLTHDLENTRHEELKPQQSYDGISTPRGRQTHLLHAEGIIGKEGGIIQLDDIYLTVPPNAVLDSQVISFDVITDLDCDNVRMTPIVKLEPLGLILNRPIQLTVPHFANIHRQEEYEVIIHSGHISDQVSDNKNKITWSQKRLAPARLQQKSLILDVQCLSYLFASIAAHDCTALMHIVRVVLFINGLRSTAEDIILTLCFCRDNDVEYNNLLADHKTKLLLEHYSTLQLRLQSQSNDGDVEDLIVMISSVENTYLSDSELIEKRICVSHIYAASRVSQQIRLKKNQNAGNDMIDVKLTISQDNENKTECFVNARVKDLMLSQESEDALMNFKPQVIKPYENLKLTIAPMLEKSHCCKLATYFELTPAEMDMIQYNDDPGRVLMKILDETEKIMPQKMSYLFHGLKFCRLDKIARIVLLYIEEHSKQSPVEKDSPEMEVQNQAIDERYANDLQTQYSSNNLPTQPCRTDRAVQTFVTSIGLSNSDLRKALTQEGLSGRDEADTPDVPRSSIVVTHDTVGWTKNHQAFMRYLVLASVDELLKISRGVLTLPSQFDF